MKVGILDIDTKKEEDNKRQVKKFPNIACGKIYGYHKMQGHEVIHPWNGEKVDKLYVSTIFSWSTTLIKRMIPVWERVAKEIIIGGSGWDAYPNAVTQLPPEIEKVDPNWTYELYDINYGIGFTVRGCHVGCGFCMVWRKEGLKEYRVSHIEKLINPRTNHLILLNNNSFADVGFFEDVEEIKERKLSVNWNQANDITILTPKHAEALQGVNFTNFNHTEKTLYFAFDQMIKTKIVEVDENNPTYSSLKYIPSDAMKITKLNTPPGEVEKVRVSFDMLKVVKNKIEMLEEYGIRKRKLSFYTLIGYDTTLENDLERFALLQQYDSNVYAMKFRDLTGKVDVDGRGEKQAFHVKPFQAWVNGKAFRNVPFFEFDRYQRALKDSVQPNLF